MTRFELIHGGETPNDNASAHSANEEMTELLTAYVDGFLDEADTARVHAALEENVALREELAAIEQTVALLHAAPPPEPPADMVQKVRTRLSQERASTPAKQASQPAAPVIHFSPGWRTTLLAGGLAVAAAAAVFILAVPTDGSAGAGVAGAGLGFSDEHRAAAITVSGANAELVAMLASEAGLVVGETASVFEGSGAQVSRFLFALRNQEGATVRGFVPEAPKLRLTVRLK